MAGIMDGGIRTFRTPLLTRTESDLIRRTGFENSELLIVYVT